MSRMRSMTRLHKSLALMAMLLVLGGCAGAVPPAEDSGTLPTNVPTSAPESTQPVTTEAAPPAGETPGSETPADGGIELAERIDFETGGDSAMHSGTLARDRDKRYALAASEGQTLHVQIISPEAPVNFTIYGPGGMSWTGELQPSEVYIFTNEFTAPQTGDYLVVLATMEIDAPNMPELPAEASYDLVITVNTAVSPSDPEVDPVDRIGFEAGANVAERSGMLPTGPGSLQYLISANVDQTLTVDATSDGTPLRMTIESPSGNPWIPELMTTPDGYTIGQQITLPEPGYYLVTLHKDDHTPSTNYTVTFTLE